MPYPHGACSAENRPVQWTKQAGSPRCTRLRTPINGGANVACSPASFSISAMQRPPIGSCARPHHPPIPITVPNFISWPAGSHCAFFAIRPARWSISATSTKAPADPIVRARAAYWRGRAAEAAGEFEEMRAQYEAAARYPTAYYGQLARARLGLEEIASYRSPPEPGPIARELLRAADILYSIGERDLAVVVRDRSRRREQRRRRDRGARPTHCTLQ